MHNSETKPLVNAMTENVSEDGVSMTQSQDPRPVVTQEDREAAADLIAWHNTAAGEWHIEGGSDLRYFAASLPEGMRQGGWDEHPVTQAFARHRIAALSRQEASGEVRLTTFLAILSAMGGNSDAGETDNWIAYFCEDDRDPDTFNEAADRGLTRVTHDDRFDSSTVYITDAGRSWLASRALSAQPLTESRQETSGEVRGLPPFADAWAKKEAKGYIYGRDALENVKFGYRIAREELSAQPLADAGDVERDWNALAERVVVAANIVSHDGYYELDIDAVARTLAAALPSTAPDELRAEGNLQGNLAGSGDEARAEGDVSYSGPDRPPSDRRLEARAGTETEQYGGHGNAHTSGDGLAGSTPAPGASTARPDRMAEMEGLRKLSEKASAGEWSVDTEYNEDGEYGPGPDPGRGFDDFMILDGDGSKILGTENATHKTIREDDHPDEYGDLDAWDEIGKANVAFIVACVKHVRAALSGSENNNESS